MLRSLLLSRGSTGWKPLTSSRNHLSTSATTQSKSADQPSDQLIYIDPAVPRKPISRLLIANRGEIACRIIRSARRLGIETVAVFSDADRRAMHVAQADQAYHIGPSPATESYLVKEKLLEVAQRSSADAIHPGYGFLSESTEFAAACASAAIKFVGPSPAAIRSMGIKSLSKAIMAEAGVPVIPGFHNDSIQGEEALLEEARKIGFPVMIKAVRGGGGKGMRIAAEEAVFLEALQSAKREASKAFGDDVVLLERFVRRPRHIEVQVFGDQHGNVVSLLERDCSSQRRHQKVIEEAPAPGISEQTRRKLGEAAVAAAKAVKYEGAGTVEFIYDTTAENEGFYFMEMNTRLQVEHPVTEMVTGLDLVEWQLRVASGEPLPRPQADFLQPRGHAFEARIYAEDPEANFMPCTGRIHALKLPESFSETSGEIRVETGVRAGDEVSVFYDPMIAKLVVWSPDRPSALAKLRQSLAEYRITGLKTNVDYLRRLAGHPKFAAGDVYTDFIADYSGELVKPKVEDQKTATMIKALAALAMLQREKSAGQKMSSSSNDDLHSPFSRGSEAHYLSGSRAPRRLTLVDQEEKEGNSTEKKNFTFEVDISLLGPSRYSLSVEGGDSLELTLEEYDPESGLMVVTEAEEGVRRRFTVLASASESSVFTKQYGVLSYEQVLPKWLEAEEGSSSGGGGDSGFDGRTISSPMPAVVEKILVEAGSVVRSGDTIAILTAMKMEHVIRASFGGGDDSGEAATTTRTVEQVFFKAGDSVAKGAKLVQFTEV